MDLFIKEFFVNLCIMFTLLFWSGQVVHYQHTLNEGRTKTQIKIGCITGLFGCILILFKMSFFGTIYVDYRNVALVLSAVSGGSLAVILTGIIMGVVRLFAQGISFISVTAACSILVAAVGCSWVVRKKITTIKKWAALFSLSTCCTMIAVIIAMKGKWVEHTLVSMLILNIIGGAISYWFYRYLRGFEKSYRLLKSLVHTDALTKLYNRRSFEAALEDEVLKVKATNGTLSLIMYDIDHFKRINDTYGHLSGDEVLKQLAEVCTQVITFPTAVYRIGGEEFAVIVPVDSQEIPMVLAQKIRRQIEDHAFHILKGEVIKVTVSLGVATYPDEVPSPYDLFAAADTALYEAKGTGRNKAVQFKSQKLRKI